MKGKFFLCMITVLTIIAALPASASANKQLVRAGLFVGANNGGPTRQKLAYAGTDAMSVSRVMTEYGGIDKAKMLLLIDPDKGSFNAAFDRMENMIKNAHENARRIEFFFYYSGHSNNKGLMLGDDYVHYNQLKDHIESISADVHIAVLDSCASGAFTRLKGGTRSAPFLIDESSIIQGHAYLTSSSEDEASQESDSIAASFFTHYFVSGLRGAADISQDGQVTLNELYEFASRETLARTEKTFAGPQHPSYSINLMGSGDLVLSDLRAVSASISLSEDVVGRISIRDKNGKLVAELGKYKGTTARIALPGGEYEIILNNPDGSLRMKVILTSHNHIEITEHDFTIVDREKTRVRGNAETPGVEPDSFFKKISYWYSHRKSPTDVEFKPFGFSPIPGIDHEGHSTLKHEYDFALGLINSHAYNINILQASVFINSVSDTLTGLQFAGIGNIVENNCFSFQTAGIFNIAGANFVGSQSAYVFNLVDGTFMGEQSAGIFSMTGGDLYGFQGSGIFNITEGNVIGAQAAGIFNIVEGDLLFLQAAGIFNTASQVSGAQVAGIFNITDGTVNGGQVSLVNTAGTVNGIQIGLVNIADSVNGVSLGLVNIISDGQLHLQAWAENDSERYAGFQTGSRHFYNIYYAGTSGKISSAPPENIIFGAGVGAHFDPPFLFLEVEALTKFFTEIDDNGDFTQLPDFIPSMRFLAGIELFKRLSLYSGFSINMHIPAIMPESAYFSGQSFSYETAGGEIILYPKVLAGIKL